MKIRAFVGKIRGSPSLPLSVTERISGLITRAAYQYISKDKNITLLQSDSLRVWSEGWAP